MEKPKGKRTLQEEATRESIVKTAMRIYGEQGFSVPVSVIANEAGVSHGSIIVHFTSKEELFRSATERFFEDTGKRMHDIAMAQVGFKECLTEFLELVEEHELFYKRLTMELSNMPADIKIMMASLRSANMLHFEMAAERDMRLGKIRELPVRMMFNTWMGLVFYYLQNGDLFAPGESVIKRFKGELVEFFSTLVGEEEKTENPNADV
ncbi:MAG: TetR/AcrR family transcriptional regulator [Clostridiales bacterium]|jgi:AcrR family transcriptional regulator|nr:TetR/AcrR family transcriptional regulator [Clostridiales bacterium]MDR2751431.1 TetR/AcrR family transcriptional regulator [Clostridiales bacterium]